MLFRSLTGVDLVLPAGLSLLERLMKDVSLYQKGSRGTYNDRYVTKLLRNYRYVRCSTYI